MQVYIPDFVIDGERIPIRLVIDGEKSPRKDFYDDINGDCTVFQTVITFKKFSSVYYPIKYTFTDIKDDQRLQVRLLQQAEFFILCDSYLRYAAVNQLNTDYKNLFYPKTNQSMFGILSDVVSKAVDSIVSMAADSEEYEAYKTLKMCIKNRRPFDRKTFDKAFSKITKVYPNLYDKMAQRWSLERIRSDLTRYADLFNHRWNSICNALAVGACPLMFQQLGMSGDKNMPLETIRRGLTFYIIKMVNDPYCTMADAKKAYDEQLQIEKEEEERRREEAMEMRRERESEGGSGGVFSSMFSTAAGVAIGNKISGVSPRRDGKKDFMGSAGCVYGKKDERGWTLRCDFRCPLYSKCTRGSR